MTRTYEEIEKEMKELKILRNKAESDYKKALSLGFKKHEECCPDICNVINQAISKLTDNITKATNIKEKAFSKSIERSLSKDIDKANHQVDELKLLKENLYAKAICNCK